jgi:hypothetical protein
VIAGLSQEGEELVAADGVFAEREGLDGDLMLRAFGIEVPRLLRRASRRSLYSS